MLKIVSTIERRVPAATSAPNDEPYSTTRRASRSNQTRCGTWWTSGWAPVAIDDAQTGVSDGKVDVARAYRPCSARKESVGAAPVSTACSNTDGVRPSMTTSTRPWPATSVLGEDAQPGVPAAPAPAC